MILSKVNTDLKFTDKFFFGPVNGQIQPKIVNLGVFLKAPLQILANAFIIPFVRFDIM